MEINEQRNRRTHKEIILTLFEQGVDPTDISNRTNHDLESVDYYIKVYNRVKDLYQKVFSREEIKKVTGSALKIIDECLRIALHFNPEAKKRWKDATKK